MATEPVHQPVQRHRLHLDVEVRHREPGPAQPSNQTSAGLPNGLIALIQDLSRLVVARRLGDERNSDLYLQSYPHLNQLCRSSGRSLEKKAAAFFRNSFS